MTNEFPYGLLALWLATSWLLGWIVLPFSRRLFPLFPDGGLAVGRIFVIVFASLGAYWFAAIRVVPLVLVPLWMLAIPIAVVWLHWRHAEQRAEITSWIRQQRGALVFSDVVFFIAYGVFLWIRLRNPTLFDLEKRMDSALMASAARTLWLPFENPWLSGVPFTNYYYFGPAMSGFMARSLGTPVAYAYNLVQPLWCALFLSGLWSLCASITKNWWRGLAAMACVGLLGNFEPLRQIYERGQWLLHPRDLNWWSTSRVVPDTMPGTREIAAGIDANPAYTINEYPIFTLSIGDLHAHFYGLVLSVLLFSLCWSVLTSRYLQEQAEAALQSTAESEVAPTRSKKKKKPVVAEPQSTLRSSPAVPRNVLLLLLGGLLGAVVITNTWDAPLFALLVIGCALFSIPRREEGPRFSKEDIFWCMVPFIITVVIAAPYLAAFKPQVKGIVREFWIPNGASFFLYWGGWLVLSVLAVLVYAWRRPRSPERVPHFLGMLGVLGLIAMLAPCFFYIRGYFGDGEYRHQDTVFKFYSQGWLLLGTAASCGVLWLLSKAAAWPRRLLSGAWGVVWTIPVLCAGSVVWFRGMEFTAKVNGETAPLSLDGSIPSSEDDAEAMEWLRRNAGVGEAVLEATKPGPGMSNYHEFARVSALTGVPTPLGWSTHVWYWGADPANDIDPRRALIEQTYGWADDQTGRYSLEELKKLNVRYIFVGDLERSTYAPEGLMRLRQVLPIVYEKGNTFIAKVP